MSFWISLRYFFSQKNVKLVNIISYITIISISFITASMFIVLSIFHGFGALHYETYEQCTPDLKIEHVSQESFSVDSSFLGILESYHLDKSIDYSKVLECEVVIQNKSEKLNIDKKSYAIIKGVDSNYKKIYPYFNSYGDNLPLAIGIQSKDYGFNTFLTDDYKDDSLIIVGKNLADRLDLKVYSHTDTTKSELIMWYLKINEKLPKLEHVGGLKNAAIFSFGEPSIDNTIIIDIESLQDSTFFNFPKLSYIELGVKNGDIKSIQKKLQNDLGNNFIVKNRVEQLPLIFKIVKTEKMVVYLIFVLIIIIAMITLIGSMFILINQKRQDIFIFYSLGYSIKKIRSIFSYLGFLIVFFGFILGAIFGFLMSVIQKTWGVLKTEYLGSTIVYPVKFNSIDFLTISLIVLGIGFMISIIVSRLVFSNKKII